MPFIAIRSPVKSIMPKLKFIPQQLQGELMKHWKLIVSAVVIAALTNMSFAEDDKASFPKGWEAHGAYPANYEVMLEPGTSQAKNEKHILIRSKTDAKETDFVAITRFVDVSHLRGKGGALAVRFKETGYSTQKEMWLRFFDDNSEIIQMEIETVGTFDPSKVRSTKPAAAFFRVPQGATRMEIGLGLRGQGSLEISKLEFVIAEDSASETTNDNLVRASIARHIQSKGATSSIDELNQMLKE
jgi:hypothetical protein